MRETASFGGVVTPTEAAICMTCSWCFWMRENGSRHGVVRRLYPRLSAHAMVSGERAATQMGGYGCWSGLGAPGAGGKGDAGSPVEREALGEGPATMSLPSPSP